MELSLEDGRLLIRIARKAVETYLKDEKLLSPPAGLKNVFHEPRGVFVTLNRLIGPAGSERKELRGCIGFPEPVKPLVEALIEAAVAAAVKDPRFPPVALEEMSRMVIDVSVLTPPRLLEVRDRRMLPKEVRIGRDGLIVERGLNRGLLLPQVAVEENWNPETFLSYTCVKAGLPSGCWLDEKTRVYRFEAVVFEETYPNGEVRRMGLDSHESE